MIRGVLRNLVARGDKLLFGDTPETQRCVFKGFHGRSHEAANGPHDRVGGNHAGRHNWQDDHVDQRANGWSALLGLFLSHRSHLLPRTWRAIRPIDYIIKYK